MSSLNKRHEAFFELHASGTFVIPNPWDDGSAKMMAALGAKALATSSAAHAFTIGKPDMGHVTRDEALSHAQDIIAATPLPVSGDFENGYGDDPDYVAETVKLAGEMGLSGCSIEDTQMIEGTPAYDFDLAVERIKAGASAAKSLGRPFVFCARADGVMNNSYNSEEALRRILAFEEAGADLLYAPLLPDIETLKLMIARVSKPVNALAAGPVSKLTVQELANLGVRRISVGSQIARLTHRIIHDSINNMLGEEGHFSDFQHSISGNKIDALLQSADDMTDKDSN